MNENILIDQNHSLVFRKNINLKNYFNLMEYYSTIYFYEGFTGDINNFPVNIKHLHFYDKFNEPIDFLPAGLETLKLGRDFNQPLLNLPPNLKKLSLGEKFKQLLVLPPQLEELSIYQITQKELDNLPKTLRKLKIELVDEKIKIPEQVEILQMYHYQVLNIENYIYDYFNFNFLLKPFDKKEGCQVFEVSTDLSNKKKALENLDAEIYFRMKEADIVKNDINLFLVLEEYGKKKLVKPDHFKFKTFSKYSLDYWDDIHYSLIIDNQKVRNKFGEEEFIKFENGYLIKIIYPKNEFWIYLESETSKKEFIRNVKLKGLHLINKYFNEEKILEIYPEIKQICSIKNNI